MKFHPQTEKPAAPRRRRGSMLAFALIFGVIVSTILLPVLSFTTQTVRVAGGTRSSDKAFYAAEAGVARGLSEIVGTLGGGMLTTGLNNPDLADAEDDSPWYPWGNAWKTMESDDSTADDETGQGQLSVKVAAWKNDVSPAGYTTYTVQATGRSMVPRELYRTVSVQIRVRSFAGYAFFNTTSLSTMDGRPRWLAPGETFNGLVHSNRHLFVYGTYSPASPLTFNSDVSIVGEEVRQSGNNNQNVVYNGLLDEDGDYVVLPSELTDLKYGAENGGVWLPDDDPALANAPNTYVDPVTTADSDINNYEFVFNADGTITITNLDLRTWMTGNSAQAQAWRTANGYNTTTAANQAKFTVTIDNTNGAFVVEEGNAFVSGIVNGRVTIGALANDNNSNLITYNSNVRTDGNIIVNGNTIYNTHPLNGGSYDLTDNREFDPDDVTDVLGLIAERNFALDGSAPANCILDAHIMLTGEASPNPNVWTDWNQTTNTGTTINDAIGQDGAFFCERGVQRDLSELWTGIVDSSESGNGTGTYSVSGQYNLFLTGGIVHFLRGQTANGTAGVTRRYAYDNRLGSNPPPFYPLTPSLSIIGWSDVPSTEDPTA